MTNHTCMQPIQIAEDAESMKFTIKKPCSGEKAQGVSGQETPDVGERGPRTGGTQDRETQQCGQVAESACNRIPLGTLVLRHCYELNVDYVA